jgi:hypothetical protein
MTTDLTMFAPLLNPWNGVVAVSTLMVIEVLKYTAPGFFGNDGGGNRWLRLMCVIGCALGYQAPGPWDAGGWVMNLFIGGLVGMAATIGYAAAASVVRFCRTAEPEPEQAIKWSEAAKKWVAVIGALIAALSGVYAAWLKPETRARESYEITSQAVEALSQDVTKLVAAVNELKDLPEAHNALDKYVAVELAKVTQRLDDMQRVETTAVSEPEFVAPVAVRPEVLNIVVEDDFKDIKARPSPKRGANMQVQMPAAKVVF